MSTFQDFVNLCSNIPEAASPKELRVVGVEQALSQLCIFAERERTDYYFFGLLLQGYYERNTYKS